MQELTARAAHPLHVARGSALIIAVALALIMAIAGVGFLLVTTNSMNNDSDAYARDKAFYAAESGANIAAKYLLTRAFTSWPSASQYTFWADRQINGFYVTVRLHKNAALRQDTVIAEAYTSTTKSASTFKKRVRIVIQNDF